MHALPYVYKLTHKTTKEFYYGSRWKNTVPAEQDLGVFYFTSSKYVKPIFSEFDTEIIAVFFDSVEAYKFEQQMIYDHWTDPLKLNRKCHTSTQDLWKPKERHSDQTKKLWSEQRKGKPKSEQCNLNMKNGMTGKHKRPDLAEKNKARKGVYKSPLKGRQQSTTCCPHCHTVGSVANMHRWHFDHCKSLLQLELPK